MQNLVQQLTSKLKELSPATMRLRRFDGSVVHFEPGKGTVEQDGVRTQTEHPLQGYKFNPDILAWTQYSAATSTTSEPLLTSRECELSVLTWNVWFDPENLAIRAKTLVDEAVTTTNASILCFQEATDTFIQILSENPVIRSKYWVSHTIPGPNSLPWPFYTCVVAVSLDHIMQIVKWARIEVPSTMGRSLWMLEVKIHQIAVIISNPSAAHHLSFRIT
ncbi:hypothetical protein BDR26DRAFT_16927 [Obelidium mucronatum]|nr:hypothetical protein BDR26DRAFT_16927 [Obelidium mucronatum]